MEELAIKKTVQAVRTHDVPTATLLPRLNEVMPARRDFAGAATATANEEDIGRFHSLPHDLLQTIPLLPGTLSYEFSLLRRTDLLHRQCTVDLVEKIVAAPIRLVLDGQEGVGKSVCLLAAMLHCMAKEWLVIFDPSLRHSWSRGIARTADPFGSDPYVRQPETCVATMSTILSMNQPILKKLKLRDVYSSPRKNVQSHLTSNSTLLDLLKYGVANEPEADLVLNHFFGELAHTDIPKLFALDEVNMLFSERSEYFDRSWRNMSIREFSIPHFYHDLLVGARTLPNTAVLGATCWRHNRYRDGVMALRKKDYGRQFDVFEVPRLSAKEISRLLLFYQKTGYSPQTNHDLTQEAALLRLLTGGNGRELRKNISMLPLTAWALPKEAYQRVTIDEFQEVAETLSARNMRPPEDQRVPALSDVIDDAADAHYRSPFDQPSHPDAKTTTLTTSN